MQSEYDAVFSLYDFDKDGSALAHQHMLYLIKSGIGKVNGALAADEAYRRGADIVITAGLAGGIDNTLVQGDVVLANKVCYHDVWCGKPNQKGQVQGFPLYYQTPEALVKNILSASPEFKTGLTLTGDCFLTDAVRLREIKADFPQALAVDMESAAIAQACYKNNVPFVSLRIISDVVGKTTQEEEYANFWRNVPQKTTLMIDKSLRALPTKIKK